MADRGKQLTMEWADGNLIALPIGEKVALMTKLLDTLPPLDLAKLRDLAEKKRKERERAQKALLTEFRQRAEQLGMSLETLLPPRRRIRRNAGRTLAVKYMSPNGDTWSGRGHTPRWLKQLEAEGHNREEYRVK